MKVMAQIAMVMNLDKCIGCHTCLQVTEQVWQPMHLSRFITIAIWAMTFIRKSPPGCCGDG